jgi:hypothetical protein
MAVTIPAITADFEVMINNKTAHISPQLHLLKGSGGGYPPI